MSENEDLSSDDCSGKKQAPQIPGANLSILDLQNHEQRENLFKWCFRVIIILYILAFVSIILAFCTDSVLSWAIIEHPHLMAIPLSLLIVPSFLLWGIVRGVYRMAQDKNDLSEFLKTIKNHPLF